MGKLHKITLATATAIIGLNTIKINSIDASTTDNKQSADTVTLAQNPATSSENQNSAETGDEMIDALQKREERIENLKILNPLDKNNLLETLQQKQLNIQSTEQLEAIQSIINDDSLDNEQILEALQKKQLNINSLKELTELRKIVNKNSWDNEPSFQLSKPLAFKLLAIGLPATILLIAVGTPIVKAIGGTFSQNIQENFGKPQVPEGSITLHSRSFKEITIIGNKAEKINDDKFGNAEFKVLIQIKIDISKGTEGYPELNHGVELLKAAIIAQKSFLKLESTELRYRSRKQQEFYQFVAENLENDVDKAAFAKKVKKKQAEVLPLITTEEGRSAINSYVKEINTISQYDLGLKLLALFKKYELKDFSVLKTVSDVVESLQAKELLSPKDLVSSVLENYDAFEKLGPILGISEAKSTPEAYARILQVIGLTNRHGKAYIQFEQLVEQLKKWEKPYKAIAMVRKEYTPDQYQIPAEFKAEIPGINVYQQYAKYLADL